jgi:hypothetical protein
VILEILVKQVNTDEKRHSDTSPRCATRRQRTRDADDWWRGAAAEDDDGARYLQITSSQSDLQ